VDLVDVYLGADQVLTGTARIAQVANERAAAELRRHEHERKLRQLASRRKAIEAQIAALQAEAEAEAAEERLAVAEAALQESITRQTSEAISGLRSADVTFKE
jgi:circadian clock protein KaiC